MGHTRIAGLFKIDDAQGPERYLGAACCLRDLGLELCDRHVGWFRTRDVELSGCTAVICHNDETAYWLVKELSYADIHVPRDISVVCFDNSYLSNLSKVRLTTLSHKPHEMGANAADTMIRLLQGIPSVSQELPWELIKKESDGPARF